MRSNNYYDFAETRCPDCHVENTEVREARDAEKPCPYCGYDKWIPVRCCMPECSRVLPHNGRFPVCRDCGIKIALLYQVDAELASGVATERAKQREDAERGRRAVLASKSSVYYVRLSEDRIKIGFSANLQDRTKSFRVPHSALMACEPGAREVEAQRHVQFRSERTRGREEFYPSDRLLAWIASVRDSHGLPEWATKPDTSTVTVRHAS